jgi:hypothetical protein
MTAQGCAFLLYPERRNQPRSNTLDTVPLIVDIVWFIPGLIPGIVCLAIDFATNSIWVHGGQDKIELGAKPGSKLSLRSTKLDQDAHVRLALMGPNGTLDEVTTTWGPKQRRERIAVRVPQQPPSTMELVLEVEGHPTVRYAVAATQ